MWRAMKAAEQGTKLVKWKRKALMVSRRFSRSRLWAMAVDPTRSTNITLSSRRSTADTPAEIGGVRAISPRAAPQSPQIGLSGRFSRPQAPHCHGRGAPQSPQNLLLAATTAPQWGHIIRSPSYFSNPGEALCALAFVPKRLQRTITRRHRDK